MKYSRSLLIAICTLSLLSSCGKKLSDTEDSVNSTEASVESGLAVVNGILDDQAGSSYAAMTPMKSSPIYVTLLRLAMPEAQAIACSRPVVQTCQSGIKSMTYNSCDLASTLFKMSGTIELSYSQSDCSLSATNSSVTRTYNVDITGPRSGVLSVTSNSSTDYNNFSYGGGGRLTKTASGWNLEILGKHKSFVRNGKQLFNVSMRTTSPWQVSGSIARGSRVISTGALEINHNIAKFTTLVTPVNLQYSSVCCHPVSGSLNLTFSGSKSGTATVTFNSCGVATLVENGQSSALELSYCE